MFKSNNHYKLVGFDETSKRTYTLRKPLKAISSKAKWRDAVKKWFLNST